MTSLEGSAEWHAWWASSDHRKLRVWLDLVTTTDMVSRLATGETSAVPRIRRSSRSVKVECAMDVQAARAGGTAEQRDAAVDLLARIMTAAAASVRAERPPSMPELPTLAALEEDPFLAAHRAKRKRRRRES